MQTSKRITPAQAVWNNRQAIADSLDLLQRMCDAVAWQNDLPLHVWVQWFAMALELQPDLVIELGRGMGNSTCVFTQAANHIGQDKCQVVSLCLSDAWQQTVAPRIAELVTPEWFEPLDARMGDILTTDLQPLIQDKQRVLVLWDAHGFEIAEYVLGHVLPLLRARQHMVIMHDMSDSRYYNPLYTGYRDYNGKGIWNGGNSGEKYLLLGHLNSGVEQCVAILDFTSRNRLGLYSCEESLQTELTNEQVVELQTLLGQEAFQRFGYWFHFSLNEKAEDEVIYFPTVQPPTERPPSLLAQSSEVKTEVANVHAECQRLQAELAQAQAKIHDLTGQISAMESSKFWKLRTSWMQIKKTLGLKTD